MALNKPTKRSFFFIITSNDLLDFYLLLLHKFGCKQQQIWKHRSDPMVSWSETKYISVDNLGQSMSTVKMPCIQNFDKNSHFLISQKSGEMLLSASWSSKKAEFSDILISRVKIITKYSWLLTKFLLHAADEMYGWKIVAYALASVLCIAKQITPSGTQNLIWKTCVFTVSTNNYLRKSL